MSDEYTDADFEFTPLTPHAATATSAASPSSSHKEINAHHPDTSDAVHNEGAFLTQHGEGHDEGEGRQNITLMNSSNNNNQNNNNNRNNNNNNNNDDGDPLNAEAIEEHRESIPTTTNFVNASAYTANDDNQQLVIAEISPTIAPLDPSSSSNNTDIVCYPHPPTISSSSNALSIRSSCSLKIYRETRNDFLRSEAERIKREYRFMKEKEREKEREEEIKWREKQLLKEKEEKEKERIRAEEERKKHLFQLKIEKMKKILSKESDREERDRLWRQGEKTFYEWKSDRKAAKKRSEEEYRRKLKEDEERLKHRLKMERESKWKEEEEYHRKNLEGEIEMEKQRIKKGREREKLFIDEKRLKLFELYKKRNPNSPLSSLPTRIAYQNLVGRGGEGGGHNGSKSTSRKLEPLHYTPGTKKKNYHRDNYHYDSYHQNGGEGGKDGEDADEEKRIDDEGEENDNNSNNHNPHKSWRTEKRKELIQSESNGIIEEEKIYDASIPIDPPSSTEGIAAFHAAGGGGSSRRRQKGGAPTIDSSYSDDTLPQSAGSLRGAELNLSRPVSADPTVAIPMHRTKGRSSATTVGGGGEGDLIPPVPHHSSSSHQNSSSPRRQELDEKKIEELFSQLQSGLLSMFSKKADYQPKRVTSYYQLVRPAPSPSSS